MADAIEQIQQQLDKLASLLNTHDRIPARLRRLKNELAEARREQVALWNQLKKEEDDVNKLERLTVTSLFYSVFKNRDRQLDIEQQEYVAAALRYNACCDLIEAHEYEVLLLADKLADLPDLKAQWKRLISKKESLLREQFPRVATKITLKDSRIRLTQQVIQQIDRAVKLGRRARSKLRGILNEVGKIKDWGQWSDGRPQYAQAGKKTLSDRLQKKAVDAFLALKDFEDALGEVFHSMHVNTSFNLESFEKFLNIFHDNLITDWIVQSNLRATRNNIQSSMDKVDRLLVTLQDEKQERRKVIATLQGEKEQLILTGQ